MDDRVQEIDRGCFEDEHIRYDEEVFTVITEENFNSIIPEFCECIYRYNMSDTGAIDTNIVKKYVHELEKLLTNLPRPYTIIQEMHHIDRSFRDTYYAYFSNQHFDVKRYSRRLSFIRGIIEVNDFYSSDMDLQKEIALNFMGACVINPLSTGVIGRTLIDPQFLISKSDRPAYVRLSDFKLHIYGKKLLVKAFPYRMQDEETMRCAEVTLLNLLEYYSNSYMDYRNVVPSEILYMEQKHSHERVLPSRGTSYPVLTKILSEFGFSPRLYSVSAIERYNLSQVTQEDELKRLLHYYIESGIPVALNLVPIGNNGAGHSMVCIGHGNANPDLMKKAKKHKWISWEHRNHCHPIIDSADFYDYYVIVDDNQPVYQVRSFKQLSLYPDMKVENIAVPLYKRMFLDASDASAIVRTVLHHKQLGIDNWSDGFLKPQEDVVIRLFMASSNSLKEYRSQTLMNMFAREAYAMVPMPRFVWVCEIYRESDYDDLNAFAEIVIDATSVPGRGHNTRSLILMHYPHVLGIRFPEQAEAEFNEMLELDEDGLFPGFRKNLRKIE